MTNEINVRVNSLPKKGGKYIVSKQEATYVLDGEEDFGTLQHRDIARNQGLEDSQILGGGHLYRNNASKQVVLSGQSSIYGPVSQTIMQLFVPEIMGAYKSLYQTEVVNVEFDKFSEEICRRTMKIRGVENLLD